MNESHAFDETLFAAGLEPLSAGRAGFLDQACAGDAVLRARNPQPDV